MKASQIRSQIKDSTVNELNDKLKELKAELFNLRFQHAINQLENPLRIKAVKKDIARVKTAIRANEIQNDSTES
ncbi:MAG: 50S ribosomal protein L29 [Clostridiales bacterium 43-6]|nr:MAG: 50S ribosomal protein L29 [Clostridiales bacterium 43-6]